MGAWSSNVRSALTGPEDTSLLPPASDIRITFELLGADTMMSASSAQWLPSGSGRVVKPLRVTLTSVTVPERPDTVIGEG